MNTMKKKTVNNVLKKGLVFIVLGAMVFSIAACGGKAKKPSGSAKPAQTTASSQKQTTASQKQTTTSSQKQTTTSSQKQTTTSSDKNGSTVAAQFA